MRCLTWALKGSAASLLRNPLFRCCVYLSDLFDSVCLFDRENTMVSFLLQEALPSEDLSLSLLFFSIVAALESTRGQHVLLWAFLALRPRAARNPRTGAAEPGNGRLRAAATPGVALVPELRR